MGQLGRLSLKNRRTALELADRCNPRYHRRRFHTLEHVIPVLYGNSISGAVPQLQLRSREACRRRECDTISGHCTTPCEKAPSLLFLQSNRLSCDLPASITQPNVTAKAMVVIGNMVGGGVQQLPSWVDDHERHLSNNSFLYRTSPALLYKTLAGAGLLVVIAVAATIFRRSSFVMGILTPASRDHAEQHAKRVVVSAQYTLRSSLALSVLACFLLQPAYILGANFYTCGKPLSYLTSAYLSDSPRLEVFVVVVWS